MILDRLKDILIANINDQLEQNHVRDKFDKALEDLEKEFNIDFGQFKREHKQWEYDQETYTEYSSSSYQQQNRYQDPLLKKEKEYYAALEVPYGSTFPEVKKAYRKLMKVYHPDLYHNDAEKHKIAQEVSLKINEAYNYFEQKQSRR
ncbi:DnaJ domain-containing protein [Algivirga pacifica]|uniref:J domain-containing protein n=1 Tax=Algivirga pacifica TaxID=1162670 RepID=A0ABP9DKQ2_9BACT